MTERVISVKMPASLVRELRALTAKHHYLDLSEQLRSIVREQSLTYTNPHAEEIKRLRDDIERQAQGAGEQASKERIMQELLRMLKEERR